MGSEAGLQQLTRHLLELAALGEYLEIFQRKSSRNATE